MSRLYLGRTEVDTDSNCGRHLSFKVVQRQLRLNMVLKSSSITTWIDPSRNIEVDVTKKSDFIECPLVLLFRSSKT